MAERKPTVSKRDLKRLERAVQDHPDASLEDLRDRCGLRVSAVTVHDKSKQLGFTLKSWHFRIHCVKYALFRHRNAASCGWGRNASTS